MGTTVNTRRRQLKTEYLLGDRRSAARYPLAGTSKLALLLVLGWLPIAVGGILFVQFLDHPIPIGIRIRLQHSNVSAQSSPGIQPLVVGVELSDSREPRLFVNYQPVASRNFDAVVRSELKQRPVNWPIYLEGDPGLEWGPVFQTLDRIRSLGAEVTLSHRIVRHNRP